MQCGKATLLHILLPFILAYKPSCVLADRHCRCRRSSKNQWLAYKSVTKISNERVP